MLLKYIEALLRHRMFLGVFPANFKKEKKHRKASR